MTDKSATPGDKPWQALADKDAIRELVLRYCRAVDRRDFAALTDLYHEDAIDDHGGMFCGPAREFIDWLPQGMANMAVVSHQVFNHLIALDGDYAEGEVYTQAYHRTKAVDGYCQEIVIGGRYLDKYRRLDDIWRFSHRRIVLDWQQVRTLSLAPDGSVGDGESPVADEVTEQVATGSEWSTDPAGDFFHLLRFQGSAG